MSARGHIEKTALTPLEKLRCAYWHLSGGIAQHDLAGIYGVNGGRVAEAVAAVRKAVGMAAEKEGEI